MRRWIVGTRALFGPSLASWLSGVVAIALLTWGALPYLSGQIDDSFIVFAYAHRIVEYGEIAWNTGVRVEGYSSPLHLLLMTAGALAGLDLAVFARVVSFVSACALLLVLHHARFGDKRGLLALAVAAWQPFQHWAVAGLETATATLIGAAGWTLVLGTRWSWAWGCATLALFTLARPEGAAWLAAGLARRFVLPRAFGAPEKVVIGALAMLGGYHALRIGYFGEVWPTPFLVKIVAVDAWRGGLDQGGREILSAAAIGIVVLASRAKIDRWAWVPLLIQAGLLVRAGGDWMGHARFLVPGLVASAAAAFATGKSRSWRPVAAVAAVLAGLTCFFWEPSRERGKESGARDRWFLWRPVAALGVPWTVPLLEETRFLVERVPQGAGASISDVGLPGNLHDVRIWDAAGLTDRVVAEVIANPTKAITTELRARYDDDDDLWCVRYGLSPSGEETAPDWMVSRLPERSPSPSTPGAVWRCREGGQPASGVVVARWARLVDRYPSQDWIRWHHARALWEAGDVEGALASASAAWWLGGEATGWLAFGDDGSFVPGRGWPLYTNASLVSLPASSPFWQRFEVALSADDPGTEGARVRLGWDDGCGGTTEVVVHEPRTTAPPHCDADGTRRLAVSFLNDAAGPHSDRNVYVSLRAPQRGTGISVAPPASSAPPE